MDGDEAWIWKAIVTYPTVLNTSLESLTKSRDVLCQNVTLIYEKYNSKIWQIKEKQFHYTFQILFPSKESLITVKQKFPNKNPFYYT
jgi:hypothetical protein